MILGSYGYMSRPLHMPCCVCSTGEMINFQQLWLYVPLPYSISILDNIFNVCAPSCGTVECLKIVSVEGLFTISQFFIEFVFPFHGSSHIFGVAEAASESMLLVEVIFYSYSYVVVHVSVVIAAAVGAVVVEVVVDVHVHIIDIVDIYR